jgi:hypothetical protein
MSITTYSELRTAVENWIGRTDLTDRVPEFITLFEAHANRKLRVRQMETSTTLTPSSGSATLPADYLQWRRVTWTGSPRQELEYVHPAIVQAYYSTTPEGRPRMFTIEGSTLKIRPTDTTGLEFDYYQKVAALDTGSNTTNWLLTAHPDAYLFGALTEATMFFEHEMAGAWKSRRDEVLGEIKTLSEATKAPGAIRTMGPIV